MSEYTKPLPRVSEENRPFWDACKRNKLAMQKCGGCGHIRYPIQATCPECLSANVNWTELTGRGTIFSKVVFHQIYDKAFAEDIPYNVVLVQLDEGPRMFSNVIGTSNDKIAIGMRVLVQCESVTEDIAVPRFVLLA